MQRVGGNPFRFAYIGESTGSLRSWSATYGTMPKPFRAGSIELSYPGAGQGTAPGCAPTDYLRQRAAVHRQGLQRVHPDLWHDGCVPISAALHKTSTAF